MASKNSITIFPNGYTVTHTIYKINLSGTLEVGELASGRKQILCRLVVSLSAVG